MDISGDIVREAYPLFQADGGGAKPTSPLQLNIGEIQVLKACQLNALWHSKFPKIAFSSVIRNPFYVCYGAEYDGRIYAVAIWSSPLALKRINRREGLELRRYAIASDAPRYTASRMLSIMIKKIKSKYPSITYLLSYQDMEVHKGTIYKASGWSIDGETKFSEWDSNKRNRISSQSTVNKIRWIKELY